MPIREQMLSVAEVCEMQPGTESNATWINPGFIAVVLDLNSTKSKSKGTPMHICNLGDTTGSAQISMTCFTPTVKFRAGDTIEIAGKGLRRTEFNGLQQVTLGRETEIHVVTNPSPRTAPPPTRRAPLDDERGGNPPPPAEEAPVDGDRATTFHQKMKANAALYLQCLSYARKIQTTLKAGNFPEMAPDHFQACVSTLFIAGDRQGLGIMPPPFGEPAQSAPTPARRAPAPAPTKPVDDEDVPF